MTARRVARESRRCASVARPSSVIVTSTTRPSSGSDSLRTWPASSSLLISCVMAGWVTPSRAASAVSRCGPNRSIAASVAAAVSDSPPGSVRDRYSPMIRSRSTVSAAASSTAVTVATAPLEFSIRYLISHANGNREASICRVRPSGISLAEVTLSVAEETRRDRSEAAVTAIQGDPASVTSADGGRPDAVAGPADGAIRTVRAARRRVAPDDVVLPPPQLPAVLLRPARLGDRHLDADDRPVVPRPRPHAQRDAARAHHRGPLPPDPDLRPGRRAVRRPQGQAPDTARHADLGRPPGGRVRRAHRHPRDPAVERLPARDRARLRQRLRQPRPAGVHLRDGPAGGPRERGDAQLGRR